MVLLSQPVRWFRIEYLKSEKKSKYQINISILLYLKQQILLEEKEKAINTVCPHNMY